MADMRIAKSWEKKAIALLVGRTIKKVGYLTGTECDHLGWNYSTIALELDDGTVIYPSQDDEGNDAGALFTTSNDLPTIPVIRA